MGRLLDLVRQLDAARPTPTLAPLVVSVGDRECEDPFPALLNTPLGRLTKPLEVSSSILGETVWLVANDRQAAVIQAKGGTAYTPEEVEILRDLYAAVKPEVWAERLRLIHQAKKDFQGRLEP